MAPYSMDLRSRVLRDADAGLPSKDIAVKYAVSRAWVDRVKQRRRETGEITPRKQTTFRGRSLTPDDETRLVALITVQRDATLGAARRLADAGGAQYAVARHRPAWAHAKKKPFTPMNSAARMWRPRVDAGARR